MLFQCPGPFSSLEAQTLFTFQSQYKGQIPLNRQARQMLKTVQAMEQKRQESEKQYAREEKPYYSLQVAAILVENAQNGLALYEQLKAKGYLVYYHTEKSDNKQWFKVKVGCFSDRTEAEAFGKEFQQTEGLEYFIVKQRLFVEIYQDKFDIVTTTSAIWFRSQDRVKELYKIAADSYNAFDILEDTQARISLSGKDVVFYYNGKIITVNIETGLDLLIREDVLNSRPQWSYDGQYIAYLDELEWEVPTSLCLIRFESLEDTCLVKNDFGTQSAVKSFHWHPHQNKIFFVEGYAYGTVTVGGNLYVIDMQGKREGVVIMTDERKEICSEFFIEDGFLIYQVAHFDPDFMNMTLTTHRIKLSEQ